MSLKSRIFAAASVDAGLIALLGSNPFRWWDQQLQQGAGFPAVVMEMIGAPRDYVASGTMPTGWTRMQFRVYGEGTDSENANEVVDALDAFLRTLDLIGLPNSPAFPNLIVNDIDFGIVQTQPYTYMRLLDTKLFVNDQL